MKTSDIILGVLLLLMAFVLYSPILSGLYHDWIEYNNNSHGLLVPFISGYLLWNARNKIPWEEVSTSWTGLWVTMISIALYIIGYTGGIDILPRLMFVCTLSGLALFNWGTRIYSAIAFPLLFLFFMVPVPVSIESIVSFPLQIWVTKVSSAIIQALSITVLREGNILHFTNTSLEVAEACSGIRSLTAYIMLGFLFAYMIRGNWVKKSFIVLIAIPLSFLINIVRVTGTGILAHFYGRSVAREFLHEFSGMVVFAVGFILLIIIFHYLNEKEILETSNSGKKRTKLE